MNNNKLIAEFMGMELGDDKTMYYDDAENLHPPTRVNELKYHESWDWLMPVVEKIESLGYEFFIVEDRIKIAHNTDDSIDTIINFTLGGSKKDATYKAVVEFIKTYNNGK